MGSRHSTAGAATVVMAVALALAACSTHSQPPAPTSTTVSPEPSSTASSGSPAPSGDPTSVAAQAAVLQAYRDYWNAQVAVLHDPSPYADLNSAGWTEVQRHAVDKALANLAATAQLYAKNGIANVGEPALSPVISNVVPGQSAAIVDCVDGTTWQPIYVASGKSAAAPGQAQRLVVHSTAVFYSGRWIVSDSVVDRHSAC